MDEAAIPQLEETLLRAEARVEAMERELQCACEALRAPWTRAENAFSVLQPGGGAWCARRARGTGAGGAGWRWDFQTQRGWAV